MREFFRWVAGLVLLLAASGCVRPAPVVSISPPPPATPAGDETPIPSPDDAAPDDVMRPTPTADTFSLVVSSQPPRVREAADSPDGKRRAAVIVYDCLAVTDDPAVKQSFELLRVIDNDTGLEYQVDTQAIYCQGLGAYGLGIVRWSAGGDALFYTPHKLGEPDGACRPWVPSVIRVDLKDWSATQFDQAVTSPDGNRLAGWSGRELVVWEWDGGEVGRVAAAFSSPGLSAPVWSPDGTRLAYLQTNGHCPAQTGNSAAVLVDVGSLTSRIVALSGAPEFAAVDWIDDGRLRLAGAGGVSWELELKTGELIPMP